MICRRTSTLFRADSSRWSVTNCVPTVVFIFLLIALVSGSFAQTITGQHGAIIAPSADPYPAGSFGTGFYYRSLAFGSLQYSETPLFLTTGLSPDIDVGFSFPSIWGTKTPPAHFEGHTLLSVKYRPIGTNTSTWRMAFAGLVERSPVANDTFKHDGAVPGIQVINTFRLGNGYHLHLYASHFIAPSERTRNRDNIGAGMDRLIASQFMFTSDLLATSNSIFDKPVSVTALTGLKYQWKPNIQFALGGGVGVSHSTYDWQYFIGVSFSAESKKISYNGKHAEGLVFPLDATTDTDQSYMELDKGTPPPAETGAGVVSKTDSIQTSRNPSIKARLFFDRGSYVLNSSEQKVLSEVNHDLSRLNGNLLMIATGHTDFEGGYSVNRAMSLARTLTVAKQVLSESGIPANRLIMGAAGKEVPNDKRATDAGQQLNRRVELEGNHKASMFQSVVRNGYASPSYFEEFDCRKPRTAEELMDLGNSVRQILDGIGEIKANEALVVDVSYPSKIDYRVGLLSAAEQWVLVNSVSHLESPQLFLHLHPNGPSKPEKMTDAKPYPARMMDWTIREDSDNVSVAVTLQNKDATQAVDGYLEVVAEPLILKGAAAGDSGKTKPETVVAKSERKKIKLKKQQRYVFPMDVENSKDLLFTLKQYSADGKLLESYPLLDKAYFKKWSKHFKTALELPEDVLKEVVKEPVLMKYSFRKITMEETQSSSTETNRRHGSIPMKSYPKVAVVR